MYCIVLLFAMVLVHASHVPVHVWPLKIKIMKGFYNFPQMASKTSHHLGKSRRLLCLVRVVFHIN